MSIEKKSICSQCNKETKNYFVVDTQIKDVKGTFTTDSKESLGVTYSTEETQYYLTDPKDIIICTECILESRSLEKRRRLRRVIIIEIVAMILLYSLSVSNLILYAIIAIIILLIFWVFPSTGKTLAEVIANGNAHYIRRKMENGINGNYVVTTTKDEVGNTNI